MPEPAKKKLKRIVRKPIIEPEESADSEEPGGSSSRQAGELVDSASRQGKRLVEAKEFKNSPSRQGKSLVDPEVVEVVKEEIVDSEEIKISSSRQGKSLVEAKVVKVQPKPVARKVRAKPVVPQVVEVAEIEVDEVPMVAKPEVEVAVIAEAAVAPMDKQKLSSIPIESSAFQGQSERPHSDEVESSAVRVVEAAVVEVVEDDGIIEVDSEAEEVVEPVESSAFQGQSERPHSNEPMEEDSKGGVEIATVEEVEAELAAEIAEAEALTMDAEATMIESKAVAGKSSRDRLKEKLSLEPAIDPNSIFLSKKVIIFPIIAGLLLAYAFGQYIDPDNYIDPSGMSLGTLRMLVVGVEILLIVVLGMVYIASLPVEEEGGITVEAEEKPKHRITVEVDKGVTIEDIEGDGEAEVGEKTFVEHPEKISGGIYGDAVINMGNNTELVLRHMMARVCAVCDKKDNCWNQVQDTVSEKDFKQNTDCKDGLHNIIVNPSRG
jgi:hypothetical protein